MRGSGILCPISSLPSSYGIGCFSKEAYEFVDFLQQSGQSYWQILPVGQTSYGDSPYQSFSTFAGNPYFICLESLIQEGLLTEEECNSCDFGNDPMYVDYGKLYEQRYVLLKKAFKRSNVANNPSFQKFLVDNQDWIHDFGLFMALKSNFHEVSWIQWPEEVRVKDTAVLESYCKKLNHDIEFHKYLQFLFFLQWDKLKQYANQKGIQIIGDIPIYVAFDSADAWAHPELFQFDEDRKPLAVAGCPPDDFSKTGQLWGNPLYQWEYHEKTNYQWWIRRVAACYRLYDVLRIDHFRGFDEYYSIPALAKTAEHGCWRPGPGMKLMNAIQKQLGNLDIIVEDLGFINESVKELVAQSGFPNMKVLEFAFDVKDTSGLSEYLPHNYHKNCVVYTGTHDNETLVGWLDHLSLKELEQIDHYLGGSKMNKVDRLHGLIRLAQSSTANLCVVPIQDYLGLGNEARINKPATIGTNWRWRLVREQINQTLALEIKDYAKTYGRYTW